MELDRERLGGVGTPHSVTGHGWWGGLGRGGCVGQWGEGDVTSRFTTGRAILAVEFWGEAMEGAGPHVLRWCRGVWSTRGWRAALGRSS